MPVEGSKEYALSSSALENLADGIKKHAKDDKFPAFLSEKGIREQRTSLEDVRETYEKSQAEADQAYDVYSKFRKKCDGTVASAQRTLQGYHGLRSELLKDYGYSPPKPGGRKGPRKPK